MEPVALINKVERVVIVLPLQERLAYQIHSIQCYGERFLDELLIISSAPGEIELNPNWTWKFLIDSGLYELDSNFIKIPMYKDQQH